VAGAEGGDADRGRWSAAVGLTLAVLLLAVFDALALVLLPLAMLLIVLPAERRAGWVVAGVALWFLALLFSGGPLGEVSRGWALMLAAIYYVVTLARPEWPVTSRTLVSVGVAAGAGFLGLLATGQLAALDALVESHFTTVSALTMGNLQNGLPDSSWAADLRAATEMIGQWQARLFPALLALQSLAALALASWWVRRIGRSEGESFALAPLADFRFNDQLIWLLIGALLVMLLPFGAGVNRLSLNVLVFMVALYALRGLAVFVFLAKGSRSVPTMVLGSLALVFLYPVAITAAVLMGVGDTWLDVRKRVAVARPT
jgi:hypothetical protein